MSDTAAESVRMPKATRAVINDLRKSFGSTRVWSAEVRLDCNNSGPAVAWWKCAQADDLEGQRAIARTAGWVTLFAGAVEMSLAMSEWNSRNDHTSNGDHGIAMLDSLSNNPAMHPYEALLASTLAVCIAGSIPKLSRKRPPVLVVPTPLSPVEAAESALGLMSVIAHLVEHRFDITLAQQAESFTRVLTSREVEELPDPTR